MMRIRTRFSLRMLLLKTAAAALACYWGIVRPTVTASKFARAVEAGDYLRAESLFCDSNCGVLSDKLKRLGKANAIVNVKRRGLRDILGLRHPLSVMLLSTKPRLRSTERVGYQLELVATPSGIQSPVLQFRFAVAP
jgi:hypothetical protein